MGVDGGGGGAGQDADRAAGQREQDRLGQELDPDLAAGGAQGAAQPDLRRRSRTEMIMMLATPTAPTSSATAPRPRNRVSKAPLASACAVERCRGLGDVDLAGVLRVGLSGEQAVDGGGGGLVVVTVRT